MGDIEFAAINFATETVFETVLARVRIGTGHQGRHFRIVAQGKNFPTGGRICHHIATVRCTGNGIGILPKTKVAAILLHRAEP